MAAVKKISVKGVERGGNRKVVAPGMYRAKVRECNEKVSKAGNDVLEVIIEITTKGEYKGCRLWTYVGLSEAAEWKLAEFIDAVGSPEETTVPKLCKHAIGKEMQVKIEAGVYNEQPKAEVGTMFSLDSDDSDDETEDDDEDEDDTPVAEDDDEEEDDEEVDYEDASLEDLREEVESRGLTVKGKTKKALIAALVADDENEGDDEEEDEEEDDGLEAELAEMDRKGLKAKIKEEDLGIKVTKSKTDDTLREEILEAMRIPF